ncbi:MAG: thioredoxin-dependent thiol peroxidase [Rikenellaceae bacterium]
MGKLNVGDLAPEFELNNQNGELISSESLKGKKYILYFYPKDNTSGCTAEACSLRDGQKELEKMGFTILGVSKDSEASHRRFIVKQSLTFTLLADTEHAVAEKFGVWTLKKMCGKEYMGMLRHTFIVDENGKIERIFEKVNTKAHFEQIVDSYK